MNKNYVLKPYVQYFTNDLVIYDTRTNITKVKTLLVGRSVAYPKIMV